MMGRVIFVKNRSLCEETPTYTLLLYRKDNWLRGLEIILFLLGFLFILLPNFTFRSIPFVIGLLVLAGVVMAISPLLYLLILRPRYILLENHLTIRKRKWETVIPLKREQMIDLHYLQSGNERIPLLVSDQFLAKVKIQLEKLRYG